jgi:hypothetical protein
MDDRFLNEHRRTPRPAFARALREQLRDAEAPARHRHPLLQRLVVTTGALAAVAALFFVPAVRAVAQNALSVFRVQTFTPVEFDPSKIEKLSGVVDPGENPLGMVLGEPEVVRKPEPPKEVATLEEAAGLTGLGRVLEPEILPRGMERKSIAVTGAGEMRVTVKTQALREILDALDAGDVRVPDGLDGQPVSVAVPAIAMQEFRSEKRRVALAQAASPEVTLPPGVALAELGEMGLRVLGLSRQEARRIAESVDWRSTLLVPVPMGAGSFQNLTVRNHNALLMRDEVKADDGTTRTVSVLVWAEGDRVFALQGSVQPEELVQMAESLR